MSLISFHRFLIVAAILFCLGFGAWELRAWMLYDGGAGAVALAAIFVLLAVALAVYLARLRAFLNLAE